jgi:hypothetical protein
MDHLPEHVWRDEERRGRRHFLWRQRVIPVGIPLTTMMIFWLWKALDLRWRDLLRGRGLVQIVVTAVVGIGVTFLGSLIEWEEHKKHFQ